MQLIQIGDSTWIEPNNVISIEACDMASKSFVRVRQKIICGSGNSFRMFDGPSSEIHAYVIDAQSLDDAKLKAREIARKLGAEVTESAATVA